MRSQLTAKDLRFLETAIQLSAAKMRAKQGGPFGAVIVRRTDIISRGWNQVTSSNDPTAHAEITAIRAAASALKSFQLRGCVLYSSCEPCPMCLAAAYWARVDRIVFAATRADAAAAGFDDKKIYSELARPASRRALPMRGALREQALKVLEEWRRLPGKTPY